MAAMAAMPTHDSDPATRLALLDRWQHGFPLVARPYAELGAALGLAEPQVRQRLHALLADGHVARIGGVWGAGAGGASLLCAMAVPPARLDAVAAQVSAQPGVNHNYEREHTLNLWFVVTGADPGAVEQAVCAVERDSGLTALRLPMVVPYHIDLGFGLGGTAHRGAARAATATAAAPVAAAERPLAAWVEHGLPLVERPYDLWGAALGLSGDAVRDTLARWLDAGTLRRFGVVVRHHELGYTANAMTVFDVADARVDAAGSALARQPGVTLCYRRARADGWPYNLYCMVHGRDRDAVQATVAAALANAGLAGAPRATLFSRWRYSQRGGRYFRDLRDPRSCDARA